MRYIVELAIPANTSKASPASEQIQVSFGTLVQTHVQIPPGPAGLAGVRVFYWSHQIIPASPDKWLLGDDVLFPLPERLELHEDPLVLTVEGYNLDDTYEHTIILHFDVLAEDPASGKVQLGVLDRIATLLGL